MELQKFKEKNNKQKSIIIFTIACVTLITGVFIYKSFASFQVIKIQDYINGSIEDPGDIYFAFYKNGKLTKEIPTEEEGNFFLDEKESYCGVLGTKDENIKLSFNPETRDIIINGAHTTHTKCYLYFRDQYHITIGETTYNANVNDGSLTLTKQQDGKIFMCNNEVNIKEENNQIKIENITKDTKCNYYDTSSEALQAVDNTPNYMFFLVDETTNSKLTINKTQEVTIDLNGHTLNGAFDNYGHLRIVSTKDNQKGKLLSGGYNCISIYHDATLLISNIFANGNLCFVFSNGDSFIKIIDSDFTSNTSSNVSAILTRNQDDLYIANSNITGPHGIGGEGGNIVVENSNITGTMKNGITVNEFFKGDITIKGKSVISGEYSGVCFNGYGTLILDGDIESIPILIGKTRSGIEGSKILLEWRYGELYGKKISEILSSSTVTRNDTTIITEDKDTMKYSYLK